MSGLKRIDWAAVVDELRSSISNERVFADGASPCERALHEGNILRMEAEIGCIEEGDYDPVIDFYGEEFFKEIMEE